MDFLTSDSVWMYLFIFFGKIIEVSVATIRIVLINRGERTKGSIIAFVEIVLWIFITGTVLADFRNNPLKIVVFSLAFAIGNFVGSWLESKIALGLSTIQVITCNPHEELVNTLRANNLAVTVMDGEGKEGPRKILLIHLKRNRIASTVKLINKTSANCVVSVSDVKMLRGGFIKK